MAAAPLQRDTIQPALEQLLLWPEIARSPQLARFLDYIVQRTLDGEEPAIKAYSIAVDVFGRGADFDPQSDPIVRVQARRLRSLLDEYYRTAGVGDAIQIRLPVGRYIPEFVEAPAQQMQEPVASEPIADLPPASRRPRGGLTISWYVLAVLAIGTAMAAYALSTWGPRQDRAVSASGALQQPGISVVEFQNLAGSARPLPQVAGLAIELVTDLEQFENIAVSYRAMGDAVAAPELQPVNDFVLTGIVRLDGTVVQYSAILTESRTGSVVWNQTLPVPLAEAAMPGVLDRVSRAFSLVLGSPRGPLHAAARQLMATPSADRQINLYLCGVLFDRYRQSGSGADAQEASQCLANLPETEKQDAVALAMSASLLVEYVPSGATSEMAPADRFRLAQENLTRAVGLDPISGFIWEQQARLHELQGSMALAQADFASAVQLNPANADALAAFARLLALAGGLNEAEPMARAAAEDSPDPPPWYFGVPALLALRDGNFSSAIESAELYAQADRELGPVLAIMAAQGVGNGGVVNRYLPQVLDVASFRARGVLPRLRQRIADDALIESIRTALTEAGVPWSTLMRSF